MSKFKYATLDVFTHTRFAGNPLAIVHIPPGSSLTYDQKLAVAREFNFFETVFLSEPTDAHVTEIEIEISIFTTSAELPFAGHPTVGTGFYILSGLSGIFSTVPSTITLKTLSGRITVLFDSQQRLTRLSVAHNLKLHKDFECAPFKAQQPLLAATDFVNGLSGPEPIFSIVKGMTFILFELASVEALSRLRMFPRGVALPEGHLGDHARLLGVYSYVRLGMSMSSDDTVITTKVQTRMFDGSLEDPATGSAACALASFLALTTSGGAKVRVFEITQGVEMGRRSDIRVKVVLTALGAVEDVELGGGAVGVMEGFLTL